MSKNETANNDQNKGRAVQEQSNGQGEAVDGLGQLLIDDLGDSKGESIQGTLREQQQASDAGITPYRSDFFKEVRKHLNDDSDKEEAENKLAIIEARTNAFIELKKKINTFIQQFKLQSQNDPESILKDKQKQLI